MLEYFRGVGFECQIVELDAGSKFPQDIDFIDAAVFLGGPMNVYEENKHPFLKKEIVFLNQLLEEKKPILGICLGSQLLAQSCGAKVGRASCKEIGFSSVYLNESGLNDPLFSGLPQTLDVFQWHEDTFEIPPEGQLIATSRDCPHQAFRINHCAYGLQFHIEVTDEMIESWIKKYFKCPDPFLHPKGEKMLSDYKEKKQVFDVQAQRIYENFNRIIILSLTKNQSYFA